MKKHFLITVLCSLFALGATKAQSLGPGSIAFLAIQTDQPDAFAFVTITDVPAGDSIWFTDNGWSGTALFTTENTAVWYNEELTPAGTVVWIEDGPDPDALCYGAGQMKGKLNGLSGSGDQILAYVKNEGAPSFIAGISTNGWLETCNTVGSGNSNTSCLPAPLVNGVNAITLRPGSPDVDNGFFDIIGVIDNAQAILELINNVDNWVTGEPDEAGTGIWPEWAFEIVEGTPGTVFFQTSGISIEEGGMAETITLSISPVVYTAQTITVQADINGNVTASDFETTPAHTNGTISLNVPAGVGSVSFTISAVAGDEVEGAELTTLSISEVTSGLEIGQPNTINMVITEPAVPYSALTFTASTASVNEGESVDLSYSISPALTEAATFEVLITPGNGVDASDFSTIPAANSMVISISAPAGSTGGTILVSATDDSEAEDNETLTFTLQNAGGNMVLGAITSVEVTIIDNDGEEIEIPSLYINEIQANNSETYADDNGEYDAWIELYNAESGDIDLGDFYLTDNMDQPGKFSLALTGTIAANGFQVIWADGELEQGDNHASFVLNPDGGFVALFVQVNGDYFLVDSVSYGALETDLSWGRLQDGNTPWVEFTTPTPNGSNNTIGIQNVAAALSVYPNPANSSFRINTTDAGASVLLFAADGRLALNTQVDANGLVDISNLNNGIYHIQVIEKSGTRVARIVVMN